MKNLKKVLALVLAFACAFTMFAGALTFSDVKPGDDYSAAITMLSDLEVISGNGKGAYEPNKAITRAEACVLIANIMNGGKADTARFAGGSNFSDVAKTYWGESAIAYCVQMGVTYGVGGGKFAPNRVITDAEFVAMVTRAMGYDTPTNPLKFPYGNYAAAVDNGILDNVPYVEGSDCTKGEAAQILYDCLFADYARYTANQNIIHNADDHDDDSKLIHVVFGLDRAASGTKNKDEELIKCTQHKWVIVGYDCTEEDTIIAYPINDKDDEVVLESKKPVEVRFECEADITGLIGYEVALWGEEEHGTNKADYVIDTVKAIEVLDDQVAYEYNPTMDIEDDLDLDEDDVIGQGYGYTENITVKNGNSYVLIDWDNDGEIDYTVATIREYYTVKAVTSKTVKLVRTDKQEITLELDGKTKEKDVGTLIGITHRDEDGKTVTVNHEVICEIPDDIEADDIVEIVKNPCEYEKEATWTMSIVEADTKEVTDVEAKSEKVYFDGEVIKVADKNHFFDDTKEQYKALDEDVDMDLYLNANGYIIKMEESDETYNGYLLVLGQDDGSNSTGKRHEAQLDVFYDDGTDEEDVYLDADAEIEIVTKIDGANTPVYDDDAYDTKNNKIDANLVGRVFKYTKDGDVITKLKQVAYRWVDDYDDDKIDDVFYYNDKQEKLTIVGEKSYWMDKLDVVFVVKESAFYDNYDSSIVNPDDQDTLMIDADDVKAVKYTDLPSINAGDTRGYGVAYNYSTKTTNTLDDAAMIIVDTFKYFDDIDTTIALVSEIKENTKTDIWTVTAIIPGKAEDSYKTIDADDMDSDTLENLKAAREELKEAEMLYVEVEFRGDEIIEFNPLTVNSNDKAPETFDQWIKADDMRVGRVILNRVNSKGELIVSKAQYTGEGSANPITSTSTSDEDTYKLADNVAFYELDDKDDDNNLPKAPGHIGYYYETINNFLTDSVKKLSESAGTSYFDDLDEDEGEYYMADIIVNDDDEVVAIIYFPEMIKAKAYEPKVTKEVTADTTSTDAIAAHLWVRTVDEWNDSNVQAMEITETVAKQLDKNVTVVVEREVKNDSSFDDQATTTQKFTLTKGAGILNVALFPAGTEGAKQNDFVINIDTSVCTLQKGDKITVTVAGYSSCTVDNNIG